ncbi:MAG: hypothetical protein ABI442_02330 [Gemmatimonadaceae bacterium]
MSMSEQSGVHLLRVLIDEGWCARSELAGELVVSPKQIDAYADGRAAMPLDRQLCLALFVVETIPALVTIGRQLREAVAARMSVKSP